MFRYKIEEYLDKIEKHPQFYPLRKWIEDNSTTVDYVLEENNNSLEYLYTIINNINVSRPFTMYFGKDMLTTHCYMRLYFTDPQDAVKFKLML